VANGFRVEANDLGQVSQELREATGSMAGAIHALGKASPQAAGQFELENACAGFADDWSYGLKQLNETLHAISEGLDATAKAYRDTDAAIKAPFAGKAAA